MTNTLKVTKLALIVASMAALGSAYSPAQAAGEADCNSHMTKLAIMSGFEGSVPPLYADCVPGAVKVTPANRGVAVFPVSVAKGGGQSGAVPVTPAYQGSAGVTHSPRQDRADKFTWPADVQRSL